MTLYIFVDIVFCCTLTFIYTFLFFLSKLLFMCHGMLMHPSHQMAGSSLLNKLMFPMQSREFGLEDMKHTYVQVLHCPPALGNSGCDAFRDLYTSKRMQSYNGR